VKQRTAKFKNVDTHAVTSQFITQM